MSRRTSPPSYRVTSWANLFILILGIGTIIYIYNPTSAIWLRGIAYTMLVLGGVWLVIRALHTQMSRGREALFILGGIGVAYAMMQPDIQGWFHINIPLQLTPLGLTDTSTGQLLIQNWVLLVALLAVLAIGIYLTPKNEPGLDFR